MIKAYKAYQECDVEWIDKIPSKWLFAPNRSTLEIKKKKVGSRWQEYVLLSLTKEGVIVRDMESGKGKFPESFESYQEVLPGDLIFCLFDMDETPRTVGLSDKEGMITSAYTIFRCKTSNIAKYVYYYYLSLDDRKCLRPLYSGLRKVIQSGRFLSTKLPLPPPHEQRNIANFLDHKCAQIDRFIEKKKRLIALLKEQKTAVINQAVTKGLDPDVPMKDSGIEWLGEIPAHWEIWRLKHLAVIRSGIALSSNKNFSDPIDLPYLRVANVQDGYLDLKEVLTIRIDRSQISRYLLNIGDLLMNEGGDFDKLGRGCVWNGEIDNCVHQNHVFAVRMKKKLESEWVNMCSFVSYARSYFISKSKRTTNLASISSSNIKEFSVIVPPRNERLAIRSFIAKESSLLNASIDKSNLEIEYLREYKESLIAHAVLGKIDVRDWQLEEVKA